MALKIDDTDDRIVIALDFGTTFSGIAFAFAGKPEIQAITEWPGIEGHGQSKVPTSICYDSKDPNKYTWGGEEHEGDVIYGIKLMLDPDQERPEYLPKSPGNEELKRLGKMPVDVAADFISAIYQHALKIIKTRVPLNYFRLCEKVFVLTVPAVWSDKAKDLTLQAAKKADIYPVTLIKEPEAAALYSLKSLSDYGLKIGDSFVVCDAGGGTVDLISYEIIGLSPRLELKELVPSTGSMAGSLGLNRRFQEAINDLVGNDEFNRLRKTKAFLKAMDYFDKHQKTKFREDRPNATFDVHFNRAGLPDIPDRGLLRDCWEMKGTEMKSIFDPLITDIKRLVEDQVKSIALKRLREQPKGRKKAQNQNKDFVKAIVLVGGFGSSEYLRSCIEQAHDGIQVIQPTDAWASIVKGAVLSNMEGEARVTTTLSPRHYGIKIRCEFDEEKDKGTKSWFCPRKGYQKCTKMKWFLGSGEELKNGQRIKHKFHRSLPEKHHPIDLMFKELLYQCEEDDAPKYPSPETKKNCQFTADMRKIHKKHFKRFTGWDGNSYVSINFELVITIHSAVMKFSLELEGVEMGSVDVNYE